MEMSAYRARAQEYATALGGAHHRHYAGVDPTWEPTAIHAAFADVIADEAIDHLADLAQDGNAGARLLWGFAVRSRLRAVAAPHDAQRARLEGASGLAALTEELAVEQAPLRRHELEEARMTIVAEQLSGPAAAALDAVRREIRALGWPSARALWTAMTKVDLGALGRHAETVLREEAAPALDGALTRADGPAWHRAAWADHHFPADGQLALLHDALRQAGADPDAPGFAIDAEPRPGKSPRAFCAAVTVPGDVHLVVRPGAGVGAAESLFHEAGHALLLASRDPSWRFEERHLLPAHLGEAAAFAFEARLPDFGDERLREHLRLRRVLRRRRQAARLLHELDLLDRGPVKELRERYAQRMATATGLDWPGAPWLVDADPLLTAADYVRAEQLL